MTFKKSLFNGLRGGGIILCLVCAMILSGCPTESSPRTGKDITSFTIDKAVGAINEPAQSIAVVVPETADLAKLTPEIKLSEGAKVSPDSNEVMDFTNPTTYLVTAENGITKAYVVTVTKKAERKLVSLTVEKDPYKTIYIKVEALADGADEAQTTAYQDALAKAKQELVDGLQVRGFYSDNTNELKTVTVNDITVDMTVAGQQDVKVTVEDKTAFFRIIIKEQDLQSIRVVSSPYKTDYIKGEALVTDGLIVEGTYADGSVKQIDVATAVLEANTSVAGNHNVKVTVDGKDAFFNIYVKDSENVALNISIQVSSDKKVTVFGLPADGSLILSRTGAAISGTTPTVYYHKSAVISVGDLAAGSSWNNISWVVDGVTVTTGTHIFELSTEKGYYLVGQPHYVTFKGTLNGVAYSERIRFTVVK